MPFQHLFTKREQRIVSGGYKEELVQRAAGFGRTEDIVSSSEVHSCSTRTTSSRTLV